MPRYIDADKLLADYVRLEQEAFEECQKVECGTENYKRWSIILNERTSYKYDVMDAPTEDVAPVKHAFWKEEDPLWFDDDGHIWYALTCANCNKCFDVTEFAQKNYHYCPNCGAKMEEEND